MIESLPAYASSPALSVLSKSAKIEVSQFAERLLSRWEDQYDSAILSRLLKATYESKPWIWVLELEESHPNPIRLARRLGPLISEALRRKYDAGDWVSVTELPDTKITVGQLAYDVRCLLGWIYCRQD